MAVAPSLCRHVDDLDFDSVRVVEEHCVIAGGVGVLARLALERPAVAVRPPRPCVDDLARGCSEGEVVKPHVVTVIGCPARLRLTLAQAEGGTVGAAAEIDDRLAALTGDLAATGVAERLEEPPVEGEAPLQLRDDEINVIDSLDRRSLKRRRGRRGGAPSAAGMNVSDGGMRVARTP